MTTLWQALLLIGALHMDIMDIVWCFKPESCLFPNILAMQKQGKSVTILGYAWLRCFGCKVDHIFWLAIMQDLQFVRLDHHHP